MFAHANMAMNFRPRKTVEGEPITEDIIDLQFNKSITRSGDCAKKWHSFKLLLIMLLYE